MKIIQLETILTDTPRKNSPSHIVFILFTERLKIMCKNQVKLIFIKIVIIKAVLKCSLTEMKVS